MHVIMAEPDGSEVIHERLAKRGVENLPYTIHSDGEHKLCASPKDEIYLTDYLDMKKKFGPTTEYTDYYQIQPTMIVADSKLRVRQWWSWKKLTCDPSKSALQLVDMPQTKAAAAAGVPPPQCRLVSCRPSVRNVIDVVERGVEITCFDVNEDGGAMAKKANEIIEGLAVKHGGPAAPKKA